MYIYYIIITISVFQKIILFQCFKTVYIPEKNICMDEALCPWRGRAAFRVYVKDKPVKCGIKMLFV